MWELSSTWVCRFNFSLNFSRSSLPNRICRLVSLRKSKLCNPESLRFRVSASAASMHSAPPARFTLPWYEVFQLPELHFSRFIRAWIKGLIYLDLLCCRASIAYRTLRRPLSVHPDRADVTTSFTAHRRNHVAFAPASGLP